MRVDLPPLPDAATGGGTPCAGGFGVVTVDSPAVASGYVPEADPRLADGRFIAGDLGGLAATASWSCAAASTT